MEPLNREVLGLIPWLAGSWLLASGAMLLLWFSRGWGRPAGAARRWLEGPGWLVAPGEVLAALYALGGPYAALLAGFLDPAAVGLAGFSWWPSLGQGALLAAGLLPLTWLAWQVYLRIGTPPGDFMARSRRLAAAPAGRPLFLLWAAAEEVHWAFYRALPLLLWGLLPGLWIGLLLVVAEHYSSLQTTARLRQPGGVEEEAWWLTKLVVMTAAFAVLRNLWVCIALHGLLEGLVAGIARRHVVQPSAPLPGMPSAPLLMSRVGGGENVRAATPVVVFAAGAALVLLALLTGQAAWPALVSSVPPVPVAPPTALVVPTATPTATPFPTLPATATPTATPRPTPTVTPTPLRTYVVQEGDILKDIAAAFNVSVADLMRVNGITDPTKLQIGQVLIIP
jgi:LysM repeat protein